MSIDHVSRVLGLSADVTGTNRMVLFVLAEAANQDTDECWPKVSTIRARAGLAQDRYVQKAIGWLAEHGYIEVELNGAPDNRIRADQRPNLYRMLGVMAVSTAPKAAQSASGDGGAQRAGSSATGVRDAQHGGARRAATGVRDAQIAPHIQPEVEPEEEPVTSPDGDPTAAPDYGFDAFWEAWPRRNGKKLGRRDALKQWGRLKLADKRAAWRGAVNYAAASAAGMAGAMDAFRWLRDRRWEDWQDPATPDVQTRGSRSRQDQQFDALAAAHARAAAEEAAS